MLVPLALLAVSASMAVPPAASPAAGEQPAAASAEGRAELLGSAFEVASAIPAKDHGRERARQQELVGVAFIDLGLVDRARMIVPSIEGWRGAALLARVALKDAEAGRADDARSCAARVLEAGKSPSVTDWQREALSVWAARIHAALGDDALAAELEKGVG